MSILKINTNANLLEIISSINSGIDREYLFEPSLKKNRLQEIIHYANKIKNENIIPFIEVKFASKYGRREKRIEIVGKNNNIFIIYKISKISKFDKDALEIQNIINEVRETLKDISIKGVLLFSDKTTDTKFINSSLSSITTDLTGDFI